MRPRRELYKDKDWLYQKYWQEELSPKEMAILADCSKRTILEWMKCYRIPRRTRSQNRSLAWKRGSYGSEDYRAKLSKAATKRLAAPEARQALSAAAQQRMANPEYRRKIASGVRRAWQRGDFEGTYDGPEIRAKRSTNARNAWQRGAYDSPEYSANRSALMKLQWDRGDFDGCYDDPEYRQTLSERASARWLNGDFDAIFQSPTSIELAISGALDNLGIEHESQYRPTNYTRVFDEYIRPHILIEINGDYWHANPALYQPESFTEHQLEITVKDREKQAWAKQNGYCLLIIWEKDIHEQGAETILLRELLPLLEMADE